MCPNGRTSELLDISSLPPHKFKKGTRVYVHFFFFFSYPHFGVLWYPSVIVSFQM